MRRLLDLVLPGPVIFGGDAGRGAADDLLGSDQVADVVPPEVMPGQVLQRGLTPALFKDLDQGIGGQAVVFSTQLAPGYRKSPGLSAVAEGGSEDSRRFLRP